MSSIDCKCLWRLTYCDLVKLNYLPYYVFRRMIFVYAWKKFVQLTDGGGTSLSAWQEQLQSVRCATSAPDVNIGVTFSYVSHEIPKTLRGRIQLSRNDDGTTVVHHAYVRLPPPSVGKAGQPERQRRRRVRGGISHPYLELQKGLCPSHRKNTNFVACK